MSELDKHIEKFQGILELAAATQPLLDETLYLRKRVENLKSQLRKNSGNSSKPPSSDGYKCKVKNNRIKSGKKIGGKKPEGDQSQTENIGMLHEYREA